MLNLLTLSQTQFFLRDLPSQTQILKQAFRRWPINSVLRRLLLGFPLVPPPPNSEIYSSAVTEEPHPWKEKKLKQKTIPRSNMKKMVVDFCFFFLSVGMIKIITEPFPSR